MKSLKTLKSLLAKRAALYKRIAEAERKLIAEAAAIEKPTTKTNIKPVIKKILNPKKTRG